MQQDSSTDPGTMKEGVEVGGQRSEEGGRRREITMQCAFADFD